MIGRSLPSKCRLIVVPSAHSRTLTSVANPSATSSTTSATTPRSHHGGSGSGGGLGAGGEGGGTRRIPISSAPSFRRVFTIRSGGSLTSTQSPLTALYSHARQVACSEQLRQHESESVAPSERKCRRCSNAKVLCRCRSTHLYGGGGPGGEGGGGGCGRGGGGGGDGGTGGGDGGDGGMQNLHPRQWHQVHCQLDEAERHHSLQSANVSSPSALPWSEWQTDS